MKLSKTRIKEIIKEEMERDVQYLDHHDHEGEMAKRQLKQMAEYAHELAMMLDDNTQLEGWVQSKITLANDYISKVKHYLQDKLQMDMSKDIKTVEFDIQEEELDSLSEQ